MSKGLFRFIHPVQLKFPLNGNTENLEIYDISNDKEYQMPCLTLHAKDLFTNINLLFIGVTILFKKPTAKDPNLFSFLSPLSLGVWIYIVTAYMAVSLLLYVLAR